MGERESDSNDLLSSFLFSLFFFFFFFPPSFLLLPALCYAGIFFLFFVLFLAVKQQLFSSCCYVRATAVIFALFCPRSRYVFLFSTYSVPLAFAAVPSLSDLLASHPSELLSFVSPFFLPLSFFFFFLFFFSFLSLFYGLACFVVFSYPVR